MLKSNQKSASITNTKNKVVVITGTPGTGKSTLAVKLAKVLGYERVDLHQHYKELADKYDRASKSYVIDVKKLASFIKDKKKIVIDSHIAHHLKNIDLVIVMICSDLKKLEQRLSERGYSKKKVRENLDSEIFQVCLNEAKEYGHKVIVFDTGKRITFKEMIEKVRKEL